MNNDSNGNVCVSYTTYYNTYIYIYIYIYICITYYTGCIHILYYTGYSVPILLCILKIKL